MERMLRKKKDNSDYEIDRELTGKFAIEKNAEYQEKIEELEEENKKLKDDLDRIEEIKDREWIKLLNENEMLSKELEKKEKSLRAWRKIKK